MQALDDNQNDSAVSSLLFVEQSVDDLTDCIRVCHEDRSRGSYQRILKNFRSYLVQEYELEIKKAKWSNQFAEASTLEVLMTAQLRKIDYYLSLRSSKDVQ